MRTIRFFYFISLFISISCATTQLFSAVLSQEEANHIVSHKDTKYIYCGKENSNIIQVANRLSEIDKDNHSLLHQFCAHIESGFSLAEYKSVVAMLEHAAEVLVNNQQLDDALQNELDHVIDQVVSDVLTIHTLDDKDVLHKKIIALPASLEIFNLDETTDSLFSKRLVVKSPALVVSIANTALSGLSTIDGVSLAASNRVLLVNQTNPVENGLWEAQSGAWTRPADFASTTLADQAYVLISSGSVNAGSSWLCTTPLAVIDTDPITFVLFAYPDIILGANVGAGAGLVFRDKTGTTLNFKSLIAGNDIIVTNNTDDITIDTDATAANTASTIVKRDASGNFSASTITANLSGNATTANSATNFSGSLAGDVTGVQGTTVVSFVGGQTAADIAAGTVLANAATSANTASTIVQRDASGNFSAGIISLTDEVISSSLKIVPFGTAGIVHNNASGLLASSLVVNADISASAAIVDTKLATIGTPGKVSNSATTANSVNLGNAIVARDISGNFAAGTITANLSGNATTATSATTATTANDFTGSLVGDVIGTQGATVVSTVGGQTAANIATAMASVNAATSANTASTLVKRDASGRFSAGIISVTDEVISSSLTITPLNTVGLVHNSATGLLSTSLVVNADISASAAIADSKLATISTASKVSNSATTATSLNTVNTIVARDASGNFTASNVIGNLIGSASLNLLKAGDTMTGTLQLPAGTTAAPSLVFTGSTTAGLSAAAGTLTFSTNALARMKISSGGAISINAFTSPGVMHNDASGNLSSSLIVNSDVAAGAGIIDTKLATISTAGKVNNSATTATDANTVNAIVKRDTSGNFTANVITVTDSTVNGNLILSTNPSTSTAGNIFKGINTPFIHNFGISNTFVGENAGNFTMTGNGQNSILGAFSFGSNSSGDNNTGMGYIAFPDCTTGTNNIAIGSGAGATLSTGSGNIYINANANTAAEAATTRIGTSQTKCFIAGIRGRTTVNANAIAVLIDSAGQLGTISSSASVKHDIQDMNLDSVDVLSLRPVTFIYNSDQTNTRQYGLIAEEVEKVFPAIVVKNEEGRAETIQYHVLPVLLLNEMKKQQAIIYEQGESLANFGIRMEMMDKAIASLQAYVKKNVEGAESVENYS